MKRCKNAFAAMAERPYPSKVWKRDEFYCNVETRDSCGVPAEHEPIMRLTWTRGLPEQEQLREQWNALVFQMERPEVFYTWEWAAAIVRAYGDRVHPWIATAYEGYELVGVVALVTSSPTEAAFLAGNTADYCDFISAPSMRKEFVDQVLCSLREEGIRRLTLANLPADSATVAELKANRQFKGFFRTGYICAQVQLGSEEGRRSLIESLSKKKMLRRSMNTLSRVGPVTLQHDRGSVLDEHPEVLEKFCAIHVARFLATGRISNLLCTERREFLRQLARLLTGPGWFDLMSLRAGEHVVALNYGFRFHGSWFWYQPTIVNQYEELSPGYCLLSKMVEDACGDPKVELVDLGLGAEGYKERFANQQRTTLHAKLTCSRVDLWKSKIRYHSAQAIKKRPRLESMARQLQTAGQSIQKRLQNQGWQNTLVWAGRRLQNSIASADEVLLFQWRSESEKEYGDRQNLAPLTWEILSAAAMSYSEDHETLEYLLRSAVRFRANKNRGYSLLGENGIAQHVAWVAPYEGFAMDELGELLQAPSTTSVMIFDCWTPCALRGQGLYSCAIHQLAGLLSADGKDVWIFSAAGNRASVAGIEKAGFHRQASLFRRKFLWLKKTWQESRATRPLESATALSNEAVR
jgi:CelD/BcsL family acetyltransferase involved in cellulose biosynthesis